MSADYWVAITPGQRWVSIDDDNTYVVISHSNAHHWSVTGSDGEIVQITGAEIRSKFRHTGH